MSTPKELWNAINARNKEAIAAELKPVDEDKERAEFEAWIGGEESLEIVEGDIRFACTRARAWHYRDYPTELAFCAVLWRASRG